MNPLKNTVTISITRENFEGFAAGCKRENIYLYNIKQAGDVYKCTLTFSDFKKLRRAVYKTGVSVKIEKKSGLGYFWHIRRRRYGFYLGALIAFTSLVYLTSCIWVVDVNGNDRTPTEEILKVLDSKGIGIGHIRYGKNISDIKNESLIELDSLSWLWVTIDGTRAHVEVREKGDAPDVYDADVPYNLVASYPGQIVDMRVRLGQKVVGRNDVVSKGDLLVTGISSTQYRGNRYIHSRGEVIAKTWRTKSGEYANTTKVKQKTGNTEKKMRFSFFNHKVNLYLDKNPKFKDYIKKTHSKQLRIFENIYLPFTFTTDEFYEIIINDMVLQEEEVVRLAVNSLTKEIEAERHKDAITLNRTYDYEILENGNIFVSVTLESKEDIAKPKEIEVESMEEDTLGESN